MTAAADARRVAIVTRAMAREGLTATLTKPGQAGYGASSTGASIAQEWDCTVIRLPLDLRARDGRSNLGQSDGRVIVQSDQRPMAGWELTYNSQTSRVTAVETIPSGTTDVCYICAVQGGGA